MLRAEVIWWLMAAAMILLVVAAVNFQLSQRLGTEPPMRLGPPCRTETCIT